MQTMLPLLAGAFKCRNKLQGFEGPAGALPPGGMATTGATTTGGWVPGFWTIGLGASAPPALAISEDRLASGLAGACLGADPVATSMNWSMICPSAGESAWPNQLGRLPLIYCSFSSEQEGPFFLNHSDTATYRSLGWCVLKAMPLISATKHFDFSCTGEVF